MFMLTIVPLAHCITSDVKDACIYVLVAKTFPKYLFNYNMDHKVAYLM
jgi:hypothetical protein